MEAKGIWSHPLTYLVIVILSAIFLLTVAPEEVTGWISGV